ncbi:GIY-YIG nuclease family protein [Streptomyces olivaceus]|uniref:GIY-YIG nuclease family protein n=1 Tax=Streptomyces olivaceus TaxID=47716 RepID=UPI001CC9C2F3|nr:GIY-YIG nuclease family protein [Streptomyces olivaceus]MBZ6252189.1 GIY-YIG nuclease family protein [Streptomyces olivaceus]
MNAPSIRGKIIQRAQGDAVAVYRLFDAAGELLYVGMSKDPMHRWEEHRANRWWPKVTAYDVTWHPSRALAREAERDAIVAGAPPYNTRCVPKAGVKRPGAERDGAME